MECENCGLDNPAEARFCANCGTALITTGKQSFPAEPTAYAEPAVAVEYMGFWIRFGAAIIDTILVAILFAFFPLAPILYYWLFTGLRGQTPGKMLVGIKVVDERGNKPRLAIAALREIPGKIISIVVLFFGFLWIAWDTQKQGLHDKLANTYVIKV